MRLVEVRQLEALDAVGAGGARRRVHRVGLDRVAVAREPGKRVRVRVREPG